MAFFKHETWQTRDSDALHVFTTLFQVRFLDSSVPVDNAVRSWSFLRQVIGHPISSACKLSNINTNHEVREFHCEAPRLSRVPGTTTKDLSYEKIDGSRWKDKMKTRTCVL